MIIFGFLKAEKCYPEVDFFRKFIYIFYHIFFQHDSFHFKKKVVLLKLTINSKSKKSKNRSIYEAWCALYFF